MKYQNQTSGIDDAFRGFNRINQILAENWTDANMEHFNSTHLMPIANNGLKGKQEAEAHLASIDQSIARLEEQISEIDRAINHSKSDMDSELDGCIVCHCYVKDRIGNSCMRGFLIPRKHARYANDEDLQRSIAYSKLPEYDEYEHFILNEQICLK